MDFCWIFLGTIWYCQQLFEHEKIYGSLAQRLNQSLEHDSSAAGGRPVQNREVKRSILRQAELLADRFIYTFQDFCPALKPYTEIMW